MNGNAQENEKEKEHFISRKAGVLIYVKRLLHSEIVHIRFDHHEMLC